MIIRSHTCSSFAHVVVPLSSCNSHLSVIKLTIFVLPRLTDDTYLKKVSENRKGKKGAKDGVQQLIGSYKSLPVHMYVVVVYVRLFLRRKSPVLSSVLEGFTLERISNRLRA